MNPEIISKKSVWTIFSFKNKNAIKAAKKGAVLIMTYVKVTIVSFKEKTHEIRLTTVKKHQTAIKILSFVVPLMTLISINIK